VEKTKSDVGQFAVKYKSETYDRTQKLNKHPDSSLNKPLNQIWNTDRIYGLPAVATASFFASASKYGWETHRERGHLWDSMDDQDKIDSEQ
jgi:hypothetical protein